MSKHYVDKKSPDRGHYEVFTGPEGSRWHWSELDRDGRLCEDFGPWSPTPAEAYRHAADDWETNGSSANRRLAGQLRAAAAREEKKQS
jgi:hypothetical protein